MTGVNWVALTIVVILFTFVTAVGFAAARWRRATSMASLRAKKRQRIGSAGPAQPLPPRLSAQGANM